MIELLIVVGLSYKIIALWVTYQVLENFERDFPEQYLLTTPEQRLFSALITGACWPVYLIQVYLD